MPRNQADNAGEKPTFPVGRKRLPRYCGPHNPSQKGYVWTRGGKAPHYFPGLYGSPESLAAYNRYCTELQQLSAFVSAPIAPSETTVAILCAEFLARSVGRDSYTLHSHFKQALRDLQELYAADLVNEFGPLALQAVRDAMVARGWSRRYINEQIRRVVRVFKWGVSQEFVSTATLLALESVEPLRQRETTAPASKKVQPVEWRFVKPVIAAASPVVGAMIAVQFLTGMRSDNLCCMRLCDIDRTGDVWLYVPFRHKNQWRELNLCIALGPKTQEALLPLLDRPDDAWLFSPRESVAWSNAQRRLNRKRTTPVYPSELKRVQRVSEERRAKKQRDCYTSNTYYHAVEKTIRRLNTAILKGQGTDEEKQEKLIPSWHPHRLRHSAGTEVRKRFDLEHAQAFLGHTSIEAAQIYAAKDLERALEVARQIG